MLAKVNTAAVVGLDGQLVEVEVDIASGLPAFTKTVNTFHLHRSMSPT